MLRALQALRFLIMLIAVLTTMFLASIESYTTYTLLCLGYFAAEAIQLRLQPWLPPCLRIPWIPAALAATLSILYEGGVLYLLFFSVLLSLRLERGSTWEWLLLWGLWTGMNAVLLLGELETLLVTNLMYAVIVGASLLMRGVQEQKEEMQGLYDTLREQHYELDGARQRVIDYAHRVEGAAQLEERNRIAKDIHDDLGHQLIRVKLMVEAAIQQVPKDLPQGMELLYQVRDHLSGSMESLRATVRKLSPGDRLRKGFTLGQLAEDFARDSGLKVELSITGQPRVLYPSIEVALYRNAQEALTNAVRHGHATEMDIRLHYGKAAVTMEVCNNGRLPEGPSPRGIGLRGMEERVELLGGQLSTDCSEIYTLRCTIPYVRQERIG